MANLDVELELRVLRLNVGGIRGDVRDVKARTMGQPHAASLCFEDKVEQRARYERLQQLMERIDRRLAALELRYCCRALGPLISRKAS